jgi:perosamine synthetase
MMQDLKTITISIQSTIQQAMKLVNDNGRGICFVLDDRKLVGVISDGDLRRALLKGIKIEQPIKNVMNNKYISLPVNSKDSLIRSKFTNELKMIPLCDELGNLVDVADALRSHRIPIMEPQLSGRELEYVQDCIRTNWISSQGSYVSKFEKIFSEMHDKNEAIAVSNGTVALHLAMLALGIGPGDEVIVPNITFAASINTVIHCNATPVICEIEPDTWCIDCDEVEKLITKNTKAIMPVHLYGQVCNMNRINALAKSNNLLIIEDCAEAIGSSYNGVSVGTSSDAATFSFFGNKTISTGEGGMVLFQNPKIAKKARILRDHGMTPDKRYWHDQVGYNYRLTNIQAAIGVAQMEKFDEIINRKIEIANLYNKKFCHVEAISMLPLKQENIRHSNWLYTILLNKQIDRDSIIESLMQNGIDTRPVFYPLHEMPPYKNYKHSGSLINSINVSCAGLSLPSAVTLTNDDINFIAKTLIKVLK